MDFDVYKFMKPQFWQLENPDLDLNQIQNTELITVVNVQTGTRFRTTKKKYVDLTGRQK